MKTLILLVSLTFVNMAQAQFLVNPELVTLPEYSYPNPIMIDVDNDGHQDLIISQQYDNKISWFRNDGTASFVEEFIIDDLIESPRSPMCVDIDGDGFQDILMSTGFWEDVADRKIIWYRNLGDGTFSTLILIHLVGGSYPISDLGVADLDGDDDLDIYYIKSDDEPTWLQNDGLGGFSAPILLPAPPVYDDFEGYHQIEFTDFDYDGDQDLIIASERRVLLYDNLGGASFDTEVVLYDIAPEEAYIDNLEVGDLNGDNLPELIFLFNASGVVGWYENLGGAIGPINNVGTGGGGSGDGDRQLAVKDLMHHDGYPEIIWLQTGPQRVNVALNTGSGFSDVINFPWTTPTFESANNMTIVDLNYDGRMDIVTDFYGSNVGVFWGTDTIIEWEATGVVFADVNENGIYDPDEYGINDILINRSPYPTSVYTSAEGEFSHGLGGELGLTYTISPNLDPAWEISTPFDSYDVEVGAEPVTDSLDFGIYPTYLFDSLSTDVLGLSVSRCDWNVNFSFEVQNVGSTHPFGKVALELNEELTYISSVIPPDSVVGQNIYWSYDSLAWFESINYQVLVATGVPGDPITSYVRVTIDSLDEPVFELEDSVTQTITCPYDPNDKTVSPLGIEEPGYILAETEELEYTIRFQNTGTDTAINVVVRDQLDPNLDWSSLIPISSSNEMTVGVSLDGLATFSFNDIMLPDSNVNELESHGYFRYRINIAEDLPLGTVIENSADIYFDLNPPILTNTTINTLYACEPWLDSLFVSTITACAGDTIHATINDIPDFADYSWSLDGELIGEPSIDITSPGIYDLSLMVSTEDCNADTTFILSLAEEIIEDLEVIDACVGDSILVFEAYHFESGFYSDTLSSEITGCDSILIQEVVFNALPEVYFVELDDETVCVDGEIISLFGTPIGGDFMGDGIDADLFDPEMAGIGTYALYYSYEDANACSGIDSVVISVVDCLSTYELDAELITVYPNPFSDFTIIYLSQELLMNHSIVINDMLGKEVYRLENLTQTTIKIYNEGLEAGTYVLSLFEKQQNELVLTKKLIVE